MSEYYKQVEAAIQATVIDSPTSYTWFAERSPRLPLRIRRAISSEVARSHLLFTLQSQLYTDFYQVGFAAPARSDSADWMATSARTQLAETLSAANSGKGCWEPGWEVRVIENAAVAVRRRGLELWVQPADCRVPGADPIMPGVHVSLRLPKDSFNISPGYYMVLSDEPLIWDGTETLVRVYWNLRPEYAPRFVAAVTSILNKAHLPFRLKVLSDSAHYIRCDTAVLYVLKRNYAASAEPLATIYRELADGLKPGIPALTKALAPGVSLAEEVGHGESYGQHCCQLLAEGMIRAYEQGRKSRGERVQTVIDCFGEAHISLERPYLNPGSSDDYYLQSQLPRQVQPPAQAPMPHLESGEEVFLRTADDIGQRLSREAIWYEDRCNWLALSPQVSGRGKVSLAYRAMGPDLYDGTSGVALFLAELHALTGEITTRRSALGAIGQALLSSETLPSSSFLGLYNGLIGIAFATARIARLLREEALLERARRLLQRVAREPQSDREFDLLSGRAGAIAALIVLRDLLGDASTLEFAARLGDELLDTVDKAECGYSWKSHDGLAHPNLTGFSHGTAGVGYALLELFRATGELKYRQGAELAFQYERSWFSPDAANWPDFRDEPTRKRREGRPLVFRTYWCHGAPGIALSRLRAYEILSDEAWREEALIGLETTLRDTAVALRNGSLSFCLCHGLSGNAQVLLSGYQAIGWNRGHGPRLAYEIAHVGIETYAAHGLAWPCGISTPPVETPGLLLGLAGIGHFYLRLYNPTTPSVLLLRREDFVNAAAKTTRRQGTDDCEDGVEYSVSQVLSEL